MSFFKTSVSIVLALFASTTYSSTYKGCYESPGDLVYFGRHTFQSVGYCRTRCLTLNQPVEAVTNGTECFCGSAVPPPDSVVEDTLCNSRCAGYAQQMCGGRGFFSVYVIAELDSETSTQVVEPTDIALPQASTINENLQLPLPGSGQL